MKPSDWDKMSELQKKQYAKELFGSMRGQFIVSQALVKAIEAMSKVPTNRREVSNMQDMEMLLTLFPIYAVVDASEKAFAYLNKRGKKG
jgi:hypothetical protein